MAIYVVIVVGIGLFASEPLWPVFPTEEPTLHIFFWTMLVMSPALAQQMGWSYGVTSTDFVALRWGRERIRLPLSEYQGTAGYAGMVWLKFATRRVYLVSTIEPDRERFLAVLEERSRRLGSLAPAGVAASGDGFVRLRFAQLVFPASCVACGREPSGTTQLEAKLPLDVVMDSGVEFRVPVCASHRRTVLLFRVGSWVALFSTGMAVTALGALFMERAALEGVLLVGVMVGAMLFPVADFLHLPTWLGWWALGIRTSNLSGDLRFVTIHSRSQALLDQLRQLHGS